MKIPPIFDGSQLLVFGLFRDEIPNAVLVKAQSPDGPLSLRIELSSENDVGSTGMLHRLAAIKLVQELELEAAALRFEEPTNITRDKESIKNKIIQICCENGVTSKYTSFVAVDAMTNMPLNENWVMESRNVPTQSLHRRHGGMQPRRRMRSSARHDSRRSSNILRNIFPAPPKRRARLCSLPSPESSSSVTLCCSGFRQETKQTDLVTPLEKLISLQSFEGSFPLNKELCEILGQSLNELKKAAIAEGIQEPVFATALAVSFFTTELLGEKDVWELVVQKAKNWITKETWKTDEILKTAEFYLKGNR